MWRARATQSALSFQVRMSVLQQSLFDRTAIVVHAVEDQDAAAELETFLRQGLRMAVSLADGRVSSTLVAAFEQAIAADTVIVLLSPQAVARRGSGPEWESTAAEAVSLGVRSASLLLGECLPPGVLRRGPWFDGTKNRLAAFRALKRWLLDPVRAEPGNTLPATALSVDEQDLEQLRRRVADRPGSVSLPDGSPLLGELVRTCWEEFEAAIWIDCALRTPENFVAELGDQLGLALPGPMESNLEALSRALQRRRLLLAFENFRWEKLLRTLETGYCSLVTSAAPLTGAEVNTRAVLDALRAWKSDPAVARAALGQANAAFDQVVKADWETAREVGRLAASVARRQGRNEEAHCWLQMLEREAMKRHDRELALESARERAWIAEEWGQTAEFPRIAIPEGHQLSLFG